MAIKYHLNWDGKQNNGICFNDTYTWGAFFEGSALKPLLSFNYYDMMYSEVVEERPNYVQYEKNGPKVAMQSDQEVELLTKCKAWVQELGTEGNLTTEQIAAQAVSEIDTEIEKIEFLFSLTQTERDIELEKIALEYEITITEVNDYYNTKVIEYGL